MTRVRLRKKLQAVKKVWKSFSNKLQSKLHKFNNSKAIKATFKPLMDTMRSLHRLIPSRGHRAIASRRPYAASNYHVHGKNISAISIDDLFTESASSMQVHATMSTTRAQQGETSRGKEVVGMKDFAGRSSGINTIEDAWKAVVAKSPQLQVDEKAEEFISKFREDMRLQKERSLLEFQEMLARGA